MRNYEQEYSVLLAMILESNHSQITRTGECKCLFNTSIKADLKDGFPILTGRKMYWNTIKGEAQWMLSGSTKLEDLHSRGVHIWDKWADEHGRLGLTYGYFLQQQWDSIMHQILNDPYSRRHIIELWWPNELHKMSLPPCYHTLQFYVTNKHTLNLTVSARSSDVAVGLPYDMAVLAYILNVAAAETEMLPGLLTFNAVHSHINIENVKACNHYLGAITYKLPTLEMQSPDEFRLVDYVCSPSIEMIVKP